MLYPVALQGPRRRPRSPASGYRPSAGNPRGHLKRHLDESAVALPADEARVLVSEMVCSAAAFRERPAQPKFIRLALVEGMSHSEIEQATGIDDRRVTARFVRGLDRARARLVEAEAAIEGKTT